MSTATDNNLDALLQQHFGFDTFREGQREVMQHLVDGRSAAAVFPTGSGKSLCYQLTALTLDGVTIVVSPLIALMKDQIDALTARGIAARRLDSTLTADEYRDVMNQLRDGSLKLLYVAPERFNNERFRESIMGIKVSLFAVDEAHCISEWGHNFRPDYLKLAGFARACGAERVLALTATATPQVRDDICKVFDIQPDACICTGFYRPNLELRFESVSESERDNVLLNKLQERPRGPTIVYVTLQKTAEDVAGRLEQNGLPARAYHAGLKPDVRASVQDWFIGSDDGIVVATIAFGMGVDKSNIRYVYHYNLPKSLENYSQEIGRAGRDGEKSVCETLACVDDMTVLENFVFGDTPTAESVGSLLQDLFSQDENFDVSYYELSGQHDIRILVIRTLLTYLELEGYLEGGTPFYATYQFKPLMSSAEILGKFEGDRQAFLASIFKQARKASKWFHIDLDEASRALNEPRERLVRALDYLGEQEMMEVKVQGVRNRYRRLRDPDSVADLTEELHTKAQRHEEREVDRLGQIIDLIEHADCQSSALCGHFGEPLAQPCGHCSHCLNGGPTKLSPRTIPAASTKLVADAATLKQEFPVALENPICLARALCGVTSPKLTKAKVSRHALFGSHEGVSFQTVLGQLKT